MDQCSDDSIIFLLFRQKTIQFEKLKLFLEELLKDSEEEKQLLEKFRTEINLLLQEKMAHVEELRLIHTDINTVIVKMEHIVRILIMYGVHSNA